MTAIFSEWPKRAAEDFGRRPIVLRHTLADSALFSDAALERLIETTPRESYHVNTMPRDADDPHLWREGDMSGLTGKQILAAVARGQLWVHLKRVHKAGAPYRDLLDDAFAELSERMPQFQTFRRSMSVLISSPGMNVAYHADVPGQSLWQIRGRKRVWVYPARAPYLPARAIENIVLNRAADTDLTYDASFDKGAESFVLSPGDMVTWPRNCPHRVVNEDCVNVSFTTEHWTRELRAGYAADYANGLLRPWFGGRDLPRDTQGLAFYAKFALTGGHKLMRRLAGTTAPTAKPDFQVAPEAERGYRNVAPSAPAK